MAQSKLVGQIEAFLSGVLSLRDFKSWVLANLDDLLGSEDHSVVRITNELEADFVELGEGIISDEHFRRHLRALADVPTIERSATSHSNGGTVVTEATVSDRPVIQEAILSL